MSLNQIRLDAGLLSSLYAHSLVLPAGDAAPAAVAGEKHKDPVPPEAPAPAAAPQAALPFLGGNKRRFVVLVHYPNSPYLPDNAYQFLTNILNACQLSAGDIAILNLARTPTDLDTLNQQLDPAFLVAFGRPSQLTGWPALTVFQPQQAAERQFLEAPDLETLNQASEAARPLKKALWESLKKILSL